MKLNKAQSKYMEIKKSNNCVVLKKTLCIRIVSTEIEKQELT